jgi:hypothetical protein
MYAASGMRNVAGGANLATAFVGMYATVREWYDVRLFKLKHCYDPDPLHHLRSAPLGSCPHPERRIHLDEKRRDVCARCGPAKEC